MPIHTDLSFDEYRKLPGINASALKSFSFSSKAGAHFMDRPPKESPDMRIGTLWHRRLLEPDDDSPVVVVDRVEGKTKAGRKVYDAETLALADGKARERGLTDDLDGWQNALAVTSEMEERLNEMEIATLNHPAAVGLLSGDGQSELTLQWRSDGILRKARIDRYCPGQRAIVDLKKVSRRPTPGGFARHCAEYKYHVQAAYYLDGAKACGLDADRFVFIVCESEPPYHVAVFELDEESLRAGRVCYEAGLVRYARWKRTGETEDAERGIQTLSLPGYVTNRSESEVVI